MAKCKLDLTHSNFKVLGNVSESDLQAGLKELSDKLAKHHKISGFVIQPMKGYPQFQNKIWKWDFEPKNSQSGTRKGWRLYALVDDPRAEEPIATAFLCYDKKESPSGDHVKFLVDKLKVFLGQTVIVKTEEARFRRVFDSSNGMFMSTCYACFETLAHPSEGEAEIAEFAHECSGV